MLPSKRPRSEGNAALPAAVRPKRAVRMIKEAKEESERKAREDKKKERQVKAAEQAAEAKKEAEENAAEVLKDANENAVRRVHGRCRAVLWQQHVWLAWFSFLPVCKLQSKSSMCASVWV